MRSQFSFFRKDPDWHPDAGDLLLYLDGEQPSGKAARIRLHLEACWACRVEAEKVSQTISAFMDYRNRILLPSLPSLENQAGRFEDKLHALAMSTQANRFSWPSMLDRIRSSTKKLLRTPFAVPGMAVALTLVLAITLSYVWSPVVNAQQLLSHSYAVEQANDNNPNVVLHRSLRLEKRRTNDKTVLSRRRIDVWHSGGRGVTARRVYDDAGKLVAGEWSERNGSSAVYERGARTEITTRERIVPAVLDSPEDLWRFDLSARGFEGLVGTSAQAQVDKHGADYIIHYEPEDRSGNNRLLDAALTIRKADLRAVALEVTMRDQGSSGASAEPGTPVVYSIVEASFEQRPAAEVSPLVFEADAELVAAAAPDQNYPTADLQIETTYLLDRVGATLGQEVTITVGSDHKLHVEGVAATELRKEQIIGVLAAVRDNPAVVINIMTVAEALRRERAQPSVVAEIGAQAERASIPVFDELSRYFEAKAVPGSTVDVRTKIQHFSQQVSDDSSQAMCHAWILKRLANTFSPTEISSLSETAHNEYLCMVANHAQEVGQETERLQLQLGPIFFPNANSPGIEGADQSTKPANLAAAIQQLFAAASRNDAAIQSSFSLTTGSAPEGAVKVQEIQNSLFQAEQLAKWVHQTAHLNDCGGDPPRKQAMQ
jgi:hypothetical protein